MQVSEVPKRNFADQLTRYSKDGFAIIRSVFDLSMVPCIRYAFLYFKQASLIAEHAEQLHFRFPRVPVDSSQSLPLTHRAG